MPARKGVTAFDRFWGFTDASGECWLWRGWLNAWGYGHFSSGRGFTMSAHRFSWELANAQEIPPQMFVLHSCDTPACVRPEHLSLGTPAQNMRDMVERRRHPAAFQTHCKHGHEFTPENTHWRKSAGGPRDCKQCHNERQTRYRRRKAAAA